MNSKLLISLLFLCFSKIIAQKSKYDFSLSGNIKNDFSGYIFIEYDKKLDSCLVINNKFSFKGNLKNKIVSCSFFLKDKPSNVSGVYLENGDIEMQLSHKEIINNDGLKVIFFKIESIKGSATTLMQKEYFDFLKNNTKDKNYHQELLKRANNIINQNPKNPLGATIIFALLRNGNFDTIVLKKMYAKIDKSCVNQLTIKLLEQNLYPEQFVKINDNVFNFTLPDKNDKLFDTNSLKGKWFLIEFWASWCGPCRQQIPDLKKVYDLYKNKNFQIVGLSIDERKTDWIKALNKENLDWINVVENEGFGGKIIKKYNLNGIPGNFLINPEGKIIAKDLHPLDLDKILSENFK